MVLLLLRDGSHVEVAKAADVVHKQGFLVLIDYLGAPLETFPAEGVLGYTCKPTLARQIVEGESDRGHPRHGRGREEHRRRVPIWRR